MRWDILNAALAPSLYFAQGLFCRCARGAWCFTYTISYGQSCLGSGRGATKECNLCLDCGFCRVHLDFSIFHLGSCPIYLIFFFASLKIEEREKKITLSGAWESTSPVSYCHVQALRICWACLKHDNKIFLYHQQCRCFIYMVTVPVRVSHSCYVQNSPSHPCRMNAEYIIEICSAGEWFLSADPRGKSSLTHRVRDDTMLHVCACSPHPDGIFASEIALHFLQFAFPLVLIVAVPFVAVRGSQVCFLFETSMQCDVADWK